MQHATTHSRLQTMHGIAAHNGRQAALQRQWAHRNAAERGLLFESGRCPSQMLYAPLQGGRCALQGGRCALQGGRCALQGGRGALQGGRCLGFRGKLLHNFAVQLRKGLPGL